MNDEELRRWAEAEEQARSVQAAPRVIAMLVATGLLGLALIVAGALWAVRLRVTPCTVSALWRWAAAWCWWPT